MKPSMPRASSRYPSSQHHPSAVFRLPSGAKHTPSFQQLRTSDPTLFPTHHPPAQPASPASFNPPHLQQPIHYFPHLFNNSLPPPKLTASIASLHNAALVYLHRGLAIHSIRLNNPAPIATVDLDQEPFLSAVSKGFNQILLLQTGLEFSQSRQVMESLMTIVGEKLNSCHHQQKQQEQIWHQAKPVIIHCALRPRMSCVGDWAWEEIRRGNFNRLIDVWTGILQVLDQKPNPQQHPHLQHQKNTNPSPTAKTIGLDEQFFTALVVVSSTIKKGPKLSDLVQSLVDRVWSRVQASDQLVLDGIIPDPDRARYFLRAIELALIWRRPNIPTHANDQAGDREEGENEDTNNEAEKSVGQDERMIHLIRRTFLAQRPDAIQFCVDLSKRIQEAVQGSKDEPGWLSVDWSERTAEPSINTSEQMALTQNIVSVLLNGFAENGLISDVEGLIQFSRQLGGMNRYLWTSILRGLSKLKKTNLINECLNRMKVEDRIEVDFNMRCILISASIGTEDLKGGIESIDQLISLSESESLSNDKSLSIKDNGRKNKLPIEAINSILSALLQNKLLDKAEKLLKNLSGRIEPNTTTLNHFLKYHSRLNPKTELNLESALNHLKTFEEIYSIRPDVISFTILLNILMKLGFGSNLIEKLLLMMKSMNIQPNAITYGSIIHHLCRSGKSQDVHVALNLLNHIEENGIATTEITYTALIQGFLRAHIQEHESRTQGIHQSNNVTNNHVLNYHDDTSKSNLGKAIELISRLKSRSSNLNSNGTDGVMGVISSGGGARINQVIYNSLLNALFSTGEYESGFQVFKLMKSEYDLSNPRQHHHSQLQDHPNHSLVNDKHQVNNSYYYGNGFIDSYGIIFRRLIQFGQFDLFKLVYFDYFVHEHFPEVPLWIQKLIDKFQKSQS